jgi:hypothetical protein
MSWSHVGNLSAAWKHVPALATFKARGVVEALGDIDAPNLTHFVRETGSLTKGELESITRARWPKLTHLEVWFGDENYGADCTVEDVRPLLASTPPPGLISLGLKNFEFADGLISPLLDSAWLTSLLWFVLGALVLLWREAPRRLVAQAAVVVYGVLSAALQVTTPEARFWTADAFADGRSQTDADGSDGPAPLALTQELIEAQSHTLPTALDALAPGRPGVVDLYAISFAPYADEDVFSREVTLVSDLMRSRFDARQRVLQLQNHARSVAELPWATPLNLQRAIQRAAAVMNRDEDILFIHLTSHGARDGQLAASFEPLAIDSVTPQQLSNWLDEAGVRYRVLSISACYSGSWIAPLSGPGTLVMTAADADHTSYGCGSLSPLTFFGRAMYDEQLRRTHSFEEAFVAVRPVIEQREKEAGKTDGYSNPQIAVGAAIRAPLRDLEQRLDAMPLPAR